MHSTLRQLPARDLGILDRALHAPLAQSLKAVAVFSPELCPLWLISPTVAITLGSVHGLYTMGSL